MIQVQSVSKSFRQGERFIEVLKDVSFQLNEGENAAIIGPSGSGKSTLLSLLSGLETPDEGSITINKRSLSKLKERERVEFRGHYIGMVFQAFHLIPHLTALENVTLPLEILNKKIDMSEAKELLEATGLKERMTHFPHQLSGGEAQRVAMARALIHKPIFLLADEPSGSLDEETGEKVMELFFNLLKERKTTALLVTHNLDLARTCQKTFKLQGGKLQADL